MLIPPMISPVHFAGRYTLGTPESHAHIECLKRLEVWSRRRGYPSLPQSWLKTEKSLIDEYFYKYTITVSPPKMASSYWVKGKKYTAPGLFNPNNVEAFIGYHPEDGCPVLKELA